jgi:hypothetical protein
MGAAMKATDPEFFSRLSISHKSAVLAEKRLFTQASLGSRGTVIFFLGPTRVGKSRIVSKLAIELAKAIGDASVPVVLVEAATAHGGLFSMRHFMLRALDQLNHPFVDDYARVPKRTYTESDMRIMLERALKTCGTRIFIIDEAHHLLRTQDSKKRGDYLDSLKSLANTARVILILSGGYELAIYGLDSAHLDGRTRLIEFPRYKSSKTDQKEFQGILKAIDAFLPWSKGESLLKAHEFIHAGTLGSLGLVLNWCEFAVCEMVALGETRLTRDHFSTTRHAKIVQTIYSEIRSGEAAAIDFSRICAAQNRASATDQPSGGRKARPFRRKPGRDPTR